MRNILTETFPALKAALRQAPRWELYRFSGALQHERRTAWKSGNQGAPVAVWADIDRRIWLVQDEIDRRGREVRKVLRKIDRLGLVARIRELQQRINAHGKTWSDDALGDALRTQAACQQELERRYMHTNEDKADLLKMLRGERPRNRIVVPGRD